MHKIRNVLIKFHEADEFWIIDIMCWISLLKSFKKTFRDHLGHYYIIISIVSCNGKDSTGQLMLVKNLEV